MRSHHIIALTVTLSLLPALVIGQRNLDVGFFFGISHYMGDLQQQHFEVLEIHQARGLFLRYNIDNCFSIKTHFYEGAISGNDSHYPTVERAWKRNLSFYSPIYEAGVQAEFNFMNFGIRKEHHSKRLVGYMASAYLFGGVSGFYFNPKTLYLDKWYELQPLGTEGQGMEGYSEKYNRIQAAIPFGFGFKIRSTRWSCMGVELGFRRTFTDYLDDVSGDYPDLQMLTEFNPMAATLAYRSPEVDATAAHNPHGSERGNPNGNDMYFFAGLSIAVTIGK